MHNSSYFFLLLVILGSPIFAQPGNQRIAEETSVDKATFTGVLTADYPNGGPLYRKEVVQGKASGRWLEWHPDGTLRYRAWWKDGLGHGKWEYFYPDGALRSVGVYAKDQPQGLHYQYHPNGQLASESPYVEGRLEGIMYTWGSDGQPLSQQRYVGGEKVLDKPVPFEAGKVATQDNNEWAITIVPSGDTLYFTRRAPGAREKVILTSVNVGGRWSEPVPAGFARPDEDGVFITPDGRRLYTTSALPLPGRTPPAQYDVNIWYRNRTPHGWSEPIPLGPNINGIMQAEDRWPANYEDGPSTDNDGNLYYWTKATDAANGNLYTAKLLPDGSFADPTELPAPLNASGWDIAPVFSPDGQYFCFASSDRYDSLGGEDLYCAKRQPDGTWSTPRNLGPDLNTSGQESSPRFSPDGKYFFFSSTRAGDKDADGDPIYSIYYLETRFLLID